MTGAAAGLPVVSFAGFAGALFHVLNHALFKGLLFLGAGAVAHATGSRDLDRLGGLLRRMPWTGATFLVGAAAISGLPPLNGFVSEFLVYFGAFSAAVAPRGAVVVALVVIAALALIGGLAVACFAKAFGVVFLGEPGASAPRDAHEVGRAMRVPMALLALACVAVALAAPLALRLVAPAVAQVATALGVPAAEAPLAGATSAVTAVVWVFLAVIAGVALLALLRRLLLRGRAVTRRGHLGLRLRGADAADAVHRVVVRPAAGRPVLAAAADRAARDGAGGALPGRRARSRATPRTSPPGRSTSRCSPAPPRRSAGCAGCSTAGSSSTSSTSPSRCSSCWCGRWPRDGRRPRPASAPRSSSRRCSSA